MNAQVPQLFDPVKLDMALTRAMRRGFEDFLLARMAEDLSDRLATVKREFPRVLDIGTPMAAFGATMGAASALTARPPGAGMLDLAGLEPESFDLILSGFCFHAVDDLPGLLIRLRQALRPDGLLMAAFPGGDTLHELRDVLLAAESEVRGAAGLRVFPMIDLNSAGQLLQRAQFALPVADSERLTLRYDNLFGLVRDLRGMGANAAPLIRPGQPGLTRAIILRAAELYAERHADADGRIRATFEIVWLSGWAPHASQQKPLRPGSAKMRLEDALREVQKNKGGE